MSLLRSRKVVPSCLAPIALANLLGCGGDDGRPPPDNVVNIGFDEGGGCTQASFPSDQPDLSALQPPVFLLKNGRSRTSSTGQAQVAPGEPIEAEIWVSQATRSLKVELTNLNARENVIDIAEEPTSGNEAVPVMLFSDENIRGRFYMRLTLCGRDCEDREVIFDAVSCDGDREPCGANAPYERILIEKGDEVRRDDTCVDLGSSPDVGSGTLLIQ